MSVSVSPTSVVVYAAVPTNPNGQTTQTVTLSGDTSYTAVSSNNGVATASVSGSTLTIAYVAPLPVAGTPITVTVTGSPSGTQAVVSVYAYGPLAVTMMTGSGSNVAGFNVSEAGYAGNLTILCNPSIALLAVGPPNSSSTSSLVIAGPAQTGLTLTPVQTGQAVITVSDDHGSLFQFSAVVAPGLAPIVTIAPLGYPSAGVWFDFLHPDEDGLPTVGEIRGMPVTGVAPLRGPSDAGNFAWCSGNADRVGLWATAYGDFGAPITVTFAGKSDFFYEELQDTAPDSVKNVSDLAIMVSVPQAAGGQVITFTGIVTADLYTTLQALGATAPTTFNTADTAVVGKAVVGTAVVGVQTANQEYQVTRIFPSNGALGHVIQIGFQESSVYAWVVLGYLIRITASEGVIP